MSPIIYLEDFYSHYQNGLSIPDIVQQILGIHENAQPPENFELNQFSSFDESRHHLMFKLIHRKMNEELLKDLPHRDFLDLAIIVVFYVGDLQAPKTNLFAHGMIHYEHLRLWKISEEELFKTAEENQTKYLPAEIETLSRVLFTLYEQNKADETIDPSFDFIRQPDIPPLYIMSNKFRYMGAYAMTNLNLLQDFADSQQSDLMIIPSSVHEVLLIPVNDQNDSEEMNQTVCEVNQHTVDKNEWLSDHVYYYSKDTHNYISD